MEHQSFSIFRNINTCFVYLMVCQKFKELVGTCIKCTIIAFEVTLYMAVIYSCIFVTELITLQSLCVYFFWYLWCSINQVFLWFLHFFLYKKSILKCLFVSGVYQFACWYVFFPIKYKF